MNNSNTVPVSSSTRRSALLALACAFALSLVTVPALQAAAAADKALPLTPTFEKVASTEGMPFVLHLKNDSKDSLKLNGKVLLAVVNHSMDKARPLPAETLDGGKTWTITQLAGDDKVIITADGYAPLEVKVPYKL